MKYTNLLIALPLLGAMEVALAVDCSNLTQWQSQQVYTGGDAVTYQSAKYTAKWWTQNQNPAQNSNTYDVWQANGSCDPVTPLPQVSVTSPSSNARVLVGSSVSLAAAVSHPQDTAIDSVEFYLDGTLVASDNSAPYEVMWQAQGLGNRALTVYATDVSGARGESSAVNFSVVSDEVPPGDPNFKIVGYFPSWQGA